MATTVRKFSDFSASDLKFGQVTKNKSGGKVVYVSHADGGRPLYQLPLMRAPFGLGVNKDKDSGVLKGYTLSLSLENDEIINKIKEMESAVCQFLFTHSAEIWDKQKSLELITDGYNSVMKQSKDPKYKPTISLKVEVDRDVNIKTEAWSGKPLQRVDLETLEKGQNVTAIIDLNQVYFVGQAMYGVSIRVKQAKFAMLTSLKSCAFIDTDEIAEESEEGSVADEE
jgi:hypothetical protein